LSLLHLTYQGQWFWGQKGQQLGQNFGQMLDKKIDKIELRDILLYIKI
jgi:hypothetical protein